MIHVPSLFWHSALLPFHGCVVAIFVLILAETLGIYIGHRPSNYIRKILPHWMVNSPLLKVKISRFIILVFFLINFSFAGYFFQLIAYAIDQQFMSFALVLFPAFVMAWFFTLFMMHCLDQVIRPDDSVHYVRLIGRLATIVSGHARPGFSAQATVRDQTGKRHFIQVESEFGELELQSQVILVDYQGSHYIAKKITPQNKQQHPSKHANEIVDGEVV